MDSRLLYFRAELDGAKPSDDLKVTITCHSLDASMWRRDSCLMSPVGPLRDEPQTVQVAAQVRSLQVQSLQVRSLQVRSLQVRCVAVPHRACGEPSQGAARSFHGHLAVPLVPYRHPPLHTAKIKLPPVQFLPWIHRARHLSG